MGERVTCPRCGRTGVTVTTTGKLRAHRKPNGLTQGDECSASGAPAKRAVHFRHAMRERWSACGYNGNDNTVIITHDLTEVTCKFCLGTANKRPPPRPTIKVMVGGETGEDACGGLSFMDTVSLIVDLCPAPAPQA
jgi:ribosomal protein S27E